MDRRKSIQLTPEESRRFIEEGRTATLATNGRDGHPHLIAMWYAVKDGNIVMTTYGKSQKAVNIRRDPRATMMWESGTAYNKLRGLMIRGRRRDRRGRQLYLRRFAAGRRENERHQRCESRAESRAGGAGNQARRDSIPSRKIRQLGSQQNVKSEDGLDTGLVAHRFSKKRSRRTGLRQDSLIRLTPGVSRRRRSA